MEKGILCIMVGIPGSGKTTYAKKLVESMEASVLISSDDIRAELGDVNDMSKNKEVFAIMNQRVKDKLNNGYFVCYDATSLTKEVRKNLIDEMKLHCQSFVAVFINTPLEIALERNKSRDRVVPEDVIKDMFKKLQPPVIDEGFVSCRYLDENLETSNLFF